MEGVKLSPEYCWDELVVKQNLFYVPCLTFMLSKFLGFGVVAGSLVYKLPQILKIRNARSGSGIAMSSLLLEIISCTFSIIYSCNMGFPFMTYGESSFVILFNLLIIAQILSYDCGGIGVSYVGGILLYLAGLYFSLIPGFLPLSIISTLQMLVAPIVISSRLPQIYSNFKNKSTGQLSLITCGLNFGGSAARVFTTIMEVKDPLILGVFLTTVVLNGIIVAQIFFYWSRTATKEAAKKKK
eukprot:TRINITY_DN1638_c0_g1_i2.p1 TRINITY_DN1638_c0_g1~~TRINITY_DN1638_c0_g1_i2.p1  ORF type:complete len:255 (-),score=21.78 TRINITY_DN1638_c0_g1_i2:709-1431(-)